MKKVTRITEHTHWSYDIYFYGTACVYRTDFIGVN